MCRNYLAKKGANCYYNNNITISRLPGQVCYLPVNFQWQWRRAAVKQAITFIIALSIAADRRGSLGVACLLYIFVIFSYCLHSSVHNYAYFVYCYTNSMNWTVWHLSVLSNWFYIFKTTFVNGQFLTGIYQKSMNFW